jgi:drug/metabolite transporter superfamily protein YnfA
MSPTALLPSAVMVLVVLGLYYRRFRRLFGRQRVQPTRMKVRIAILLLLGVLLMLRGLMQADIAIAGVAGLGGGLVLALLGLKLTQFENTPQGRFYTPHGGIGLALSALLLGRLVYRFFVIQPSLQAVQGSGADPFAGFQRSPLTAAMFALLIGYYVVYYAGVLIRSGGGTTAVQGSDSTDR